jgi:hypothetical protein
MSKIWNEVERVGSASSEIVGMEARLACQEGAIIFDGPTCESRPGHRRFLPPLRIPLIGQSKHGPDSSQWTSNKWPLVMVPILGVQG